MHYLPEIYNSIGLAFDILGALLLWIFALPLLHKFKNGTYVLDTGTDKDIKRNKFFSGIGMLFLILGFLLQFLT